MKHRLEKIHPFAWIVFAGLLVWGITLSFDFVWDDFPMIAGNSSLHQWQTLLSGWAHDFWMLHDSPHSSGYWRPVPTMIHVLLTKCTGGSPWVFHLFNLILHIFTAFFFYLFLKSTGFVKWIWIPVLFFLWHPLVAETVSFNSAIPDLLCAFFGWAAVICWLNEKKSEKSRTVLTLGLLLLSFLSKESGVFFGIFIIGMEVLLKPSRSIQKKIHVSVAILLLIVAYVQLHRIVIHGLGIRSYLWGGDFLHHFATIFKLFAYQFFLLFFPVGSSPTRDFAIVDFSSPWAWVGVLLLTTFMGLFFYFRRRKPLFAFAIFFYLVFWFPVSNIIPGEGLVTDRYMYVMVMAVAFILGLLFSTFESFPALMDLILVGYAVWAVNNSLVWKNSETLWGNAIQVSPKSSVAWNEWGTVMSSKRQYQEAFDAYDRAFKLQPEYRDASFNRTLSVFLMKDPQAKELVDEHLKKFPSDAQAFDLLGSIYESESNLDQAMKASLRAVDAAPKEWRFRYNLAEVYLRMQKYNEAIEQLEIVKSQVQGHFEVVKNLAIAYCMNAQYQQCLDTYEEFCRRFPDHASEVSSQMEQTRQLLKLTQGK